jgi:hypothetical protein
MIEQASTLLKKRTVIATYKLRSKLSKTKNLNNLINKLKKSTLSENESEILYLINVGNSLTQINVTNLKSSLTQIEEASTLKKRRY